MGQHGRMQGSHGPAGRPSAAPGMATGPASAFGPAGRPRRPLVPATGGCCRDGAPGPGGRPDERRCGAGLHARGTATAPRWRDGGRAPPAAPRRHRHDRRHRPAAGPVGNGRIGSPAGRREGGLGGHRAPLGRAWLAPCRPPQPIRTTPIAGHKKITDHKNRRGWPLARTAHGADAGPPDHGPKHRPRHRPTDGAQRQHNRQGGCRHGTSQAQRQGQSHPGHGPVGPPWAPVSVAPLGRMPPGRV